MKVITPISIFLPEYDEARSVLAFDELFKKNGLKPLGESGFREILPSVIEVGSKFKYGLISSITFKEKILDIFSRKFGKKVQFTNKEFNQAWNAMLGNVSSLKKTVETLRDKLKAKGHKLILMSSTNVIHFDYIFRNSQMPFKNVPIFLTYADQIAEASLYERIVRETKEKGDVFLIIRGTNKYLKFKALQDQANEIRKKIRIYIAENSSYIKFKEIDQKGDVISQILEAVS